MGAVQVGPDDNEQIPDKYVPLEHDDDDVHVEHWSLANAEHKVEAN